jgi:1,4-dihydroxy-2-naphthoate octaprenyltransferase
VYGLAGATFGYFYTAPPVRLVARHGLGELAISLAFGPLITAGVGYVVLGAYDPTWTTFLIGIPVGLLTTNILVINQVPDTESDALTGKNHLIVTLGERRAPWIYGGVLLLSAVVHAWLIGQVPGASGLWWVPFAILVVYGAYIIRHIVRFLHSRELVHANVQTIMLNIVYGILFAGVLAFF